MILFNRMGKRSEKWLEDRKKEQKEKRVHDKKMKQEKTEAAEEAEEKYSMYAECHLQLFKTC